jgi:organic radical activating enzyme
MNLDQTLDQLTQQYNTSEPLYLSNFFQPNGEKWLFENLQKLYQPVFENNFRILVVQDVNDIYEYSDLPGAAITALQKIASKIDISNFFILLVTDNKDISIELEQVKKLYSSDDCAIQHQLSTIDKKIIINDDQIQDTFCVLPWMHLYAGTDGHVLPCCVADQQFPMGDVRIQSIDSIIKSTKFNQLRLNMLTGKKSKECSRCYQQEESGISSPRLFHNQKWPNIKKSNVNSDGTIEQFRPQYLDIRLSNLCNLKCRMCSDYFSSAIAHENFVLYGKNYSRESSLNLDQRDLTLKEIIDFLPYVEEIYFAGGEPLLSKEHYEILQQLILLKHTNLKIRYNTNFSTLKYRDINIVDLWKNFSQIEIGASLDACGSVAEYVRHGTVWKDIESNLEIIKTQCPHVNLTITSTLGFLNVSSLIDLQKSWHVTKKLNISKFSFTVMIGPDHLRLTALPTPHKTRIEKTIHDHAAWCVKNNSNSLATQWNNAVKYMWSCDDSHALTEFRRITSVLDQHRNESFVEVFPEYRDLMS